MLPILALPQWQIRPVLRLANSPMRFQPTPLRPELFLTPADFQALLAPAIGPAAASTLYSHLQQADHLLLARNAAWLQDAERQDAQRQDAQRQDAQRQDTQRPR